MARDNSVIQCRLRTGKDDDLRQAIEKLPASQDKSDLVRDALRLYFFGKKTEPVPEYAAAAESKKEEPVHLQKKNPLHDVVGSKLDDLLNNF